MAAFDRMKAGSPVTPRRTAHGFGRPYGLAVLLMCCAILVPSLAAQPAPTTAKRIVVVTSADGPRFRSAIAGIERNAAGLPVRTINVDADNAREVHASLIATPHDTAVIALGNRASELVERFARVAPGSRAVHCLVASDSTAHAGSNAVVVPVEIPADQRLSWLRVLLPDAKRVGILFDAAPHHQRAAALAEALRAAGFVPVLAPVTGPASLPAALAHLAQSVDAVQALPGPTVMTSETTRGLVLFSFRHRIPIIGPNLESVRAGALYALEWDYEEMGLHCAALAVRPFVTTRPPPPLPAPPQARASANLRTAEQFELRWSPEILRTIERVGP